MAMVNFYNLEIGNGLPVTLLSFAADRINEGTVMLRWQTDQETGMQDFGVQHSTDGIVFKIAGFVAARNSSGTHYYEFQHKLVRNQINYYRLKMNHQSGEITYSSIEIVRGEVNRDLALWFPSYSIGSTTNNLIVSSPQNEEASIIIYNQLGQPISRVWVSLVVGMNIVKLDNYITQRKGIFYISVYTRRNKKTIKISKLQ
jgi:hypothetical protein